MGQGAGTQPAPETNAKHLLCAFGSGWPGYLTLGNIFSFTPYCLGASVTFLTQSPGMGRAGTPEILRAVTHSGLLCPHLSNNEARCRSSKRRMSAPPPEEPGEMLGEHLLASVLLLRWGLQGWVLSASAKEEHPKEKETEFNILYPPQKRALMKSSSETSVYLLSTSTYSIMMLYFEL